MYLLSLGNMRKVYRKYLWQPNHCELFRRTVKMLSNLLEIKYGTLYTITAAVFILHVLGD
jgi:hypothetical protein